MNMLLFSRRINKRMEGILVVEKLFGFEEAFNLYPGCLQRIRSVYKVCLNTHGQFAAYRSRCSFTSFGDTTEKAHRVDAVHSLPTAGNDGRAAHKGLDFREEVTSTQVAIVFIQQFVA